LWIEECIERHETKLFMFHASKHIRWKYTLKPILFADDTSLILATSDIMQFKDYYSRVVEKIMR
jgi:hypothetical protein